MSLPMRQLKHCSLFILLCTLSFSSLWAQSKEEKVKQVLDSFYTANPDTKGIALYIYSETQNLSISLAAGYSDSLRTIPLRPEMPFNTASNTKTFVAAAIMKLVEMGRFKTEDGIEKLLDKKLSKRFRQRGYDLKAITVRHLMSHTSGISDYVNDAYFEFVNQHPLYPWTREEQISKCLENPPLAHAGDTFKYADINYVLLADIIEKHYKKPFYTAIRELCQYEKNGLHSTWWMLMETPPAGSAPMAHQYWNKYPWDALSMNPSWDLYGGGGLASNCRDMALFFHALFEGRIVKDSSLIHLMTQDLNMKAKSNYRLGVRVLNLSGSTAYYHGGFWGTDALYLPDQRTSLATLVVERGKRDLSGALAKRLIEIIKS